LDQRREFPPGISKGVEEERRVGGRWREVRFGKAEEEVGEEEVEVGGRD